MVWFCRDNEYANNTIMDNATITTTRGPQDTKMQPAILNNNTRTEFSTDTYTEEFFTDEFKDFNWQPAHTEKTIDKIKKAARSLNRFF